MLKFLPETEEILMRGGKGGGSIRTFARFDFRFHPVLVHDGNEDVNLEGCKWQGIGKILRQNFSLTNLTISSGGKVDGVASVSLPLLNISHLREILDRKYYRNRSLTITSNVMREDGSFVEKVSFWEGTIIRYAVEEDVVTFTAKQMHLASQFEKDQMHEKEVSEVRSRLGREAAIAAPKSVFDFIHAAVDDYFIGPLRWIVSVLQPSSYKYIMQLWSARRRTYLFDGFFPCNAPIGWMGLLSEKVTVRAHTADEARGKFMRLLHKRIWRFPIGVVRLYTNLNGKIDRIYNLDMIREADDPEKWRDAKQHRTWA